MNLQYIGETKRRLKERFNEHRRTIDNPDAKSEPTTAAKHFLNRKMTPYSKLLNLCCKSFCRYQYFNT